MTQHSFGAPFMLGFSVHASASGMSAHTTRASRPDHVHEESNCLVPTKVPEMSLGEWAQISAHSMPVSVVHGILGVDQQDRSLFHVLEPTGVSRVHELCVLKAEGLVHQMKQRCV